MELYLLITLLLSVILIIILYLQYKKKKELAEKLVFDKHKLETLRKEEIKNYFEEEWKQEEKQLKDKLKIKTDGLEKEWQGAFQKHHMQLSTLDNEIQKYETILAEKEKRYNEVNQDLDLYRQGKIKEIDSAAAEYEEHKQLIIKNELDQYRSYWTDAFNQELSKLAEVKQDKLDELTELTSQLEEERNKRAAINEEILRQKKLEEQQDFFRIQLNPDDSNDIELLRSITPRLRHPEAINKVIWTGYYQKPLAELRKRILTNGDVSGVYKITRLKTNEIYIGQTTSVDKRWQEHVKSALGVGALASSQLHRVMAADGCENFTFELLEVVPKDKLRERESYYIDFYDSKTYGLNSVTGDKNK